MKFAKAGKTRAPQVPKQPNQPWELSLMGRTLGAHQARVKAPLVRDRSVLQTLLNEGKARGFSCPQIARHLETLMPRLREGEAEKWSWAISAYRNFLNVELAVPVLSDSAILQPPAADPEAPVAAVPDPVPVQAVLIPADPTPADGVGVEKASVPAEGTLPERRPPQMQKASAILEALRLKAAGQGG